MLHDGSLAGVTPLKAQDLKAEGTRASTLCRRRHSRFRTHRGDFYPSVFLPCVSPLPLCAAAFYRRYGGKSLIARFRVRRKGIANPFSRRRPPETAEFDASLYLLKIRGAARIRLRGRNVLVRRVSVSTCALCAIPDRGGRLSAEWTRIFQ